MNEPTLQTENKPNSSEFVFWCWAIVPHLVRGTIFLLGIPGYATQLIYKLALISGPVIWRSKEDQKSGISLVWPTEVPFPSGKTIFLSILSALVLAGSAIATVEILSEPLGLDPATLKTQIDERFSLTTPIAVGLVIYLFSLNAALEELHFRYWLDTQVSARFGSLVGILLSSNLFAAMHMFIFAGMKDVSPLVLCLVYLALVLAGVCWSGLKRLPGGIHAAWLSHGLTDAVLLTWGLFWLGYF